MARKEKKKVSMIVSLTRNLTIEKMTGIGYFLMALLAVGMETLSLVVHVPWLPWVRAGLILAIAAVLYSVTTKMMKVRLTKILDA